MKPRRLKRAIDSNTSTNDNMNNTPISDEVIEKFVDGMMNHPSMKNIIFSTHMIYEQTNNISPIPQVKGGSQRRTISHGNLFSKLLLGGVQSVGYDSLICKESYKGIPSVKFHHREHPIPQIRTEADVNTDVASMDLIRERLHKLFVQYAKAFISSTPSNSFRYEWNDEGGNGVEFIPNIDTMTVNNYQAFMLTLTTIIISELSGVPESDKNKVIKDMVVPVDCMYQGFGITSDDSKIGLLHPILFTALLIVDDIVYNQSKSTVDDKLTVPPKFIVLTLLVQHISDMNSLLYSRHDTNDQRFDAIQNVNIIFRGFSIINNLINNGGNTSWNPWGCSHATLSKEQLNEIIEKSIYHLIVKSCDDSCPSNIMTHVYDLKMNPGYTMLVDLYVRTTATMYDYKIDDDIFRIAKESRYFSTDTINMPYTLYIWAFVYEYSMVTIKDSPFNNRSNIVNPNVLMKIYNDFRDCDYDKTVYLMLRIMLNNLDELVDSRRPRYNTRPYMNIGDILYDTLLIYPSGLLQILHLLDREVIGNTAIGSNLAILKGLLKSSNDYSEIIGFINWANYYNNPRLVLYLLRLLVRITDKTDLASASSCIFSSYDNRELLLYVFKTSKSSGDFINRSLDLLGLSKFR